MPAAGHGDQAAMARRAATGPPPAGRQKWPRTSHAASSWMPTAAANTASGSQRAGRGRSAAASAAAPAPARTATPTKPVNRYRPETPVMCPVRTRWAAACPPTITSRPTVGHSMNNRSTRCARPRARRRPQPSRPPSRSEATSTSSGEMSASYQPMEPHQRVASRSDIHDQ